MHHARDAVDEFYESIGFSIVSRAQYRKSLIDYFDMIRSGFSHDDIRYAVRWTFKHSRSRPESFSLIKYTIHDAMSDLINDLREVSGEKKLAKEKSETLMKSRRIGEEEPVSAVTNEDLKTWLSVVEELKSTLNDHSFAVFIEPLKLESVQGDRVSLSAPQDSISWIADHFLDKIQETYRAQAGRDIVVDLR